MNEIERKELHIKALKLEVTADIGRLMAAGYIVAGFVARNGDVLATGLTMYVIAGTMLSVAKSRQRKYPW